MLKPTDAQSYFKNAKFFKASGSRKSLGGGGEVCVEVAKKGDFIGVRDSKNPSGPVLAYTKEEWRVFIEGVKNGEFD